MLFSPKSHSFNFILPQPAQFFKYFSSLHKFYLKKTLFPEDIVRNYLMLAVASMVLFLKKVYFPKMMLMFFCIPLLRHRFLKWKSILQKPTYFPSYCRGEPVCSPLHRRCFHVRLSIGTQTFCSTPKDSRKGCPYTPKETYINFYRRGVPCGLPRHRRFFHVRLLTENKTFGSAVG